MNIYRTALARFRLGMSPFNAHRLRYSLSEANRACPFCPDKVEDEAHVLFDCFVYGNIRNVYINKAQNISLQEQVLSVLKCTDESSLVSLGQYLFLAVQIRKNDSKVVHIHCSAFLVSQKVLAKTVHSPFRIANTVSVKAAEDDSSLSMLVYPRLCYVDVSL